MYGEKYNIQSSESYTIEIANGWGKIFWYRKYLREQGFSFTKKSYGKSYYHKKCHQQEICIQWKQYCKKRGLKCRIYGKEYTRSSDYRKTFFDQKKYKRKYTLCAYCGLPVKVERLTVDHIIPVHKVKNTRTGRMYMKLFSIHDVNEYRNLCGACKSCNSRKGHKLGIWVIQGFIGKSILLWWLRWTIRITALCILIGYVLL